MGQYYKAIILEDAPLEKEEIKTFLEAIFGSGMKITEHSYLNNNFVNTFEYQLTKDGLFYKSRVVWAGDYADNEKNYEYNLYQYTNEFPNKSIGYDIKSAIEYPYIINHTKKQFTDKRIQKEFHPLPLLTAEGNGRGGGDYYGFNEELIGIWARDVISVEKEKPENYEELICNFQEKYSY